MLRTLSDVKLAYFDVINPCSEVNEKSLGAYSFDLVTTFEFMIPIFESILDIISLANY